ncbi:hypothetical protein ACFXHA_23345 [Nocardia sp. NPDC059240]|uniref:hypothetical protein n=1 Tax=Nocardia sp. NPDC059240 TaxID=3346786 RepID=UPI0036AD1C8B
MLEPAPDPRLHGRPELALLLDDLVRRAYRRWRARATNAPHPVPQHLGTPGTEQQ